MNFCITWSEPAWTWHSSCPHGLHCAWGQAFSISMVVSSFAAEDAGSVWDPSPFEYLYHEGGLFSWFRHKKALIRMYCTIGVYNLAVWLQWRQSSTFVVMLESDNRTPLSHACHDGINYNQQPAQYSVYTCVDRLMLCSCKQWNHKRLYRYSTHTCVLCGSHHCCLCLSSPISRCVGLCCHMLLHWHRQQCDMLLGENIFHSEARRILDKPGYVNSQMLLD